MHPIQQHVLGRLIFNEQQRFAELKPHSVDSNKFMYHLQKLIDLKLVEKTDGGYTLTLAGRRYADGLSLKSFRPRLQPRIVTLLVISDHLGRYLFYQRKRQPLLGMIGFPYGKLHAGETVIAAAQRELTEKTGLVAQLRHAGDGYVTISEDGQPISEIMFHLFTGAGASGRLARANRVGRPFWAHLDQLATQPVMPSVPDLINLVQSSAPDRFFAELVYELSPASIGDPAVP